MVAVRVTSTSSALHAFLRRGQRGLLVYVDIPRPSITPVLALADGSQCMNGSSIWDVKLRGGKERGGCFMASQRERRTLTRIKIPGNKVEVVF